MFWIPRSLHHKNRPKHVIGGLTRRRFRIRIFSNLVNKIDFANRYFLGVHLISDFTNKLLNYRIRQYLWSFFDYIVNFNQSCLIDQCCLPHHIQMLLSQLLFTSIQLNDLLWSLNNLEMEFLGTKDQLKNICI